MLFPPSHATFSLILSDFVCQVCFKKNSTLLVSLGYISPKDVYLDILYDSKGVSLDILIYVVIQSVSYILIAS